MRPHVDSEDEVSAGVEVRGGAIEVNPDRLRVTPNRYSVSMFG
jgi:hypothetical protein